MMKLETLEFAKSELNKYLLKMTGEEGKIFLFAGEDGDLGFGQIAVIRRADVPSVENGTGISIKVALATLVGLALAIGIVFLLYVTDDRIKTQEDILRSYNVPVLGVIPPESVQ